MAEGQKNHSFTAAAKSLVSAAKIWKGAANKSSNQKSQQLKKEHLRASVLSVFLDAFH